MGKSLERPYDEHCEKVVAEFLDENFYNNMFTVDSFERIQDKNIQVKGIDVIFSNDNKTYYVDEKAAVKYLKLKTFALELSFLNRKGILQTGWLLDNEKINNYFVFVWINELFTEKIVDKDSIKHAEVALVSKDKIKSYLSSLGWTEEKLKIKDKQIRNNTNVYMGNIYKNGCKFSYSSHLVEKPINILLPKEKYIELADVYHNIKKESVD